MQEKKKALMAAYANGQITKKEFEDLVNQLQFEALNYGR